MTAVAPVAEGYLLSARQVEQLQSLLDLLIADPEAPTAIRDPERALHDHLADSLVALTVPQMRAAAVVADLGSGAGLPGLPLAIARPESHFFLVESNHRKADFISRAAQVCDVHNVEVVQARAEQWAAGRGVCELVTVRALAALPVVAEYAAPLLKPGAALLAWRGRRDPEEERAAASAADELGLRIEEPQRVQPYPGAANRHLQLIVKVQPTPPRFPRRPGMARKRPLGGQLRGRV